MSDSTAPLGSIEIEKVQYGEDEEVTIGEDLASHKEEDDMIVTVPTHDYLDSHKRADRQAYG